MCHCAGRSMRGEILATTPDQHCELWEVNFLATVQVTQALADDLEASGGHVVLLGSLASKVAPRYMGAYPASKFPLVAFAQQLRLQWGRQGPHVLLVCPGPRLAPLQVTPLGSPSAMTSIVPLKPSRRNAST